MAGSTTQKLIQGEELPTPRDPLLVLLIDDEPSIHAALKALLASPRFTGSNPALKVELISAHSLHDGVELAISQRPKCILLDLCLEAGDARETAIARTLEYIPKIAPFWPIVVLTGYDDDMMWGAAVAAGALNFLQKPVYLIPQNIGFLMHSMMNAILVHKAIHPPSDA